MSFLGDRAEKSESTETQKLLVFVFLWDLLKKIYRNPLYPLSPVNSLTAFRFICQCFYKNVSKNNK